MDFDFLTMELPDDDIGKMTVLVILGSSGCRIGHGDHLALFHQEGRLYFPGLIKSGLVFLEGLMKAFFRLLGLEDREMLSFLINSTIR